MRLPAVLLLALPSLLAAQAPVITAAGDPSVRADTLYRLDPKAGSRPFVYLLDDGVIRYEADGRGTRTFRQVVYVNTTEAVEQFAERSFAYSPGHEKLTVNWTKVVKPDGTVLSSEPAVSQDAEVPAAANNPVYADTKVRRLSLAKVAPGTIVDVSYTLEEFNPSRPGDFFLNWSVHAAASVLRSRYVVELPAGLTATIREHNLPFARRERVAGGRRTITWATQDVPRIESEPFASDSNDVIQSIQVVGAGTWADIGAWYARLARDRAVLAPREAKLVDSLVAGAATRDDSIRAVHRWVAQDIRYVSVALGIGSYQPRLPAEVVSSGFGDCKDKATLFVASLAHLGIPAYPLLLSADGDVDRSLPTIRQFDHMIAAVPGPDGLRFADLTAELVPFNVLPFPLQGEFALLVKPDGTVQELTLPQDALDANVATRTFTGTLSADGRAAGTLVQEFRGVTQYPLRAALRTPPDAQQRTRIATSLASALFPGAEGDSLQLFDGRDLRAVPRITLALTGGRAARVTGGSAVLSLPDGGSAQLLTLAQSLEHADTRRFPIDAEQVAGTMGAVNSLQLTLPDGWKARLPKDVHAVSRFGRFEVTYAQDGATLRVERRIVGARGVLPPDALGELVQWLKEIAAADAEFIVLDVPGA